MSKAKQAAIGPLHLATTGAKVARMRQVWSQDMTAVICRSNGVHTFTGVFVPLNVLSHKSLFIYLF